VPELTKALRVGPQSAGAEPGPACYGKGGTEPTVTDANIVVGHLPPYLLGGKMKLDVEAAKKAVKKIADAMGLWLQEAAQGILDIVNESMCGALRLVSVERGYDPRNFALVAFGGAGPLHANALGKLMNSWPVLIPPAPGVLCAMGDRKVHWFRGLPGGRWRWRSGETPAGRPREPERRWETVTAPRSGCARGGDRLFRSQACVGTDRSPCRDQQPTAVVVGAGSPPPGRHSPTLPLLGHAEDLPGGRGPVLKRRGEPEVVEDPPDRDLIAQKGDRSHALAATGADERIDLVDLGDEACPAGGTASARWLGGGLLRPAPLPSTQAPDAVGIVAVEDRAVLAWVRDVVAHAGEPLEGVEGLEVPAQGRVHAGAVEHGPVVVEVHELLQRQGVADEVGDGVLEVVLVLGRDRLAHVRGEAGMSPGEELADELMGDGVAVEKPGEEPLAEEAREEGGVPFG